MGTMPPTRPMVGQPGHTAMAYELFTALIERADPFSTPMPAFKPGMKGNEDFANPNPGVETRTITLDPGDTLAGAIEDVGVSSADANAVVVALGKDFNPRA